MKDMRRALSWRSQVEMNVTDSRCPRCTHSIASHDTIAFDGARVVHLDCRRPCELNYEERAVLFKFCWEHAVVECAGCRRSFRQHELGADLFAHRSHLCPCCRLDLTSNIREHLLGCALVPTEVRWRAEDVRAAARRLLKQRHQLPEEADALKRQADLAMAALRDAISRVG